MKHSKLWNKQLSVIFFGNVLEFYNFSLFAMLGVRLGGIFFPNMNEWAYYLLFAAGFILRPVGGVLFGVFGDIFGRKKSIITSNCLLSCSTTIIAFLPENGGFLIFSQIILIICRVIQGVSINGEYTNSAVFILEKKNINKTYASFMLTASTSIGAFLALIAGYIDKNFHQYICWRMWFFIGGVGSFFYLYLRLSKIDEQSNQYYNQGVRFSSDFLSLLTSFKKYYLSLFLVIGIGAFSNAVAYSIIINIDIFVLGDSLFKEVIKFLIILLPLIIYLVLGGKISRYSPEKIMTFVCVAGVMLIYPSMILLNQESNILALLGTFIIILTSGTISGPSKAVYSKLFPQECRCTGVAIGKGMCGLIFGGLSPIINALISKYTSFYFIALYFLGCAIISLISLICARSLFKKRLLD